MTVLGKRLLAFTIMLLSTSGAFAQAVPPPEVDTSLDKADLQSKLDFDVPSSAAFAILGASPDNVLTPRRGSEFALGLINGLDQQGNFQSGVAIETTPFLWTLPERVQLDSLSNNRTARLLSGLSVSFATTSGQEESDEADRIGVGINYVYDFDDPLYSEPLNSCLFGISDKILDDYRAKRAQLVNPDSLGDDASDQQRETARQAATALVAQVEKEGELQVDKCYEDNISWNREVLQFGIGAHKSELTGDTVIDENGHSAWLSYSRGFGKHYQLTLHVNVNDDLLVESDDQLVVTDRQFAGIRLRVGSKKVRGFLEAGYTDEETELVSDSFWQAALGAEIQLQTGLFFQLSYGDSFGAGGKKEDFFSGQFKWAFSPTALLGGT